MKKSNEERETEQILKAMAANASMWQKQAQTGAEMQKWVDEGHYAFIQERILAPIELECFKKVKGIRLGSTGLQNVAKVQGTLEVFDIINARINHIIALGKDALDHLSDLQNSTPKEGE
jgi:transcriptional regulator